MTKRIRILVSGRVQGVYFRASAQQQAKQLSLKGYVRNLPDGQVEIVAEGPDSALQKLVAWCHIGPLMARVENVVTEEFPTAEPYTDFEVR